MNYPFARIAGLIDNARDRDRFARGLANNYDSAFETLRRWADQLGVTRPSSELSTPSSSEEQ